MGVKRNLALICLLVYGLDALYRFALQASGISHSKASKMLQFPRNVLFLISVFLQIYATTSHFCARSKRQKLALFFQIIVPGSLPVIVGSQITG